MDTAKEVSDQEKLDSKEAVEEDIAENYGKVDSNQLWKNYYEKKSKLKIILGIKY